MNESPDTLRMQQLRTVTMVVYLLQAAGFFVGITFVIAVIVNYVKRDDVRGTIFESHFRWQMRTFWFGLLWSIIGGLTWIVLVGMVVLAVNGIWLIYRVVKGLLDLYDGKPMYRDQAAS